MREKTKKALLALAVAILCGSHANASSVSLDKEYSKEIATVTFSPVAAALCNLDLMQADPVDCAGYGLVASFTTTVLFAKKLQAAQPDAIAYLAGERSSSPLLESVVADLQALAFEATGKEPSFDQTAADIAVNL